MHFGHKRWSPWLALALAAWLVNGCTNSTTQTSMASAPDPLTGTSWRLIHFQSPEDSIGTVVPPNVEQYTLQFLADGTLAMQLDCNRATARWTAEPVTATDGRLTISPGAMTNALCLPGAIDSQLARDMAFVTSYVIVDNKLSLVLKIDSGNYLWEPASDVGN